MVIRAELAWLGRVEAAGWGPSSREREREREREGNGQNRIGLVFTH